MTGKVAENMLESFGLIEEALATGPWIMGDQYTIADANLFTIATWLEGDGVPMMKLPNVAAHFARMQDRPAVKRALEITE
jgi:glutathione S-transferase